MPICVPISDLKNTSEFSRTVEKANEPVIVTKNGHEHMIVLSPEQFRRYRLESAEERLERLLDEAEQDIRSGRVADARSGLQEIRARYGL